MHISKINRTDFPLFSSLTNAYLYQNETFKDLIEAAPDLENFEAQLELKKDFSFENRQILSSVLQEQYSGVADASLVLNQIEKLKDANCFTVTTGHQLNLFGGPIFFIYKILHTINLSEILNKKFPDKHFVPVYWMASEDHDFAEINHFHLFGKQLSWEKEQGGAVGDYLLEDWSPLQESVHQFFQNYPDAAIHNIIDQYKGKNLSEATLHFVNQLFKEYGLVIVNAADNRLKQLMIPTFTKELEEQFAEKAVLLQNEKLEKLGFKAQVHVRPVNLFYLAKNSRERIVPVDNHFEIKGLGAFTSSELLTLLRENPENFSPNVVLRPIYQETILPNLAYIGGGGEIAYWLQFKGVFDALDLPFPLLQIRNSLQLFDGGAKKRAEKLGFSPFDFFKGSEALKKDYLDKNLSNPLDFTQMEAEAEALKKTVEALILEADTNLKSFAEAEKTKLGNQLENIKQKLQKIEKNRFDQALKQIEDLHEKLFPGKALQERHDNFLNFCPDGDVASLIDTLKSAIEPFEKDLIVLEF